MERGEEKAVCAMKKVLIYFPGYNKTIGGSENRFLSFVAELQDRAEVTVAMRIKPDFAFLEGQYGIHVDPARVKSVIVRAHGWRRLLGRLLACEEKMALKFIAKDYDICISCHGPQDFGKPGYHFIHMLWSFDPEYAALFGKAILPTRYSPRWCVHQIRKMLRRILPCAPRLGCDLIRDPHEVCIPNSAYVKKELEGYYGCTIGDVFYPPTFFEAMSPSDERELNVGYVGRIHEEKGIEDIIGIVECVRGRSGRNIEVFFAGHLDDSSFCQRMIRIAESKRWVHFVGEVSGVRKQEFLAQHAFAIHILKGEAFGISVSEYIKAGMVAIVPKGTATDEIVQNPELAYDTIEQAEDILLRLIEDGDFRSRQKTALECRAKFFSREAYLSRQRQMLNLILKNGGAL